ncbi:hypothetical protein AHAS_Ahas03G0125800 [Arachis hypogaea]
MCQLNLMITHLPCQGSKNQRNRRTLTREIDGNSFNSSGTACGRFNWEKRMRRSRRRASPSGLAVLVADATGFVEFRVRAQLHPSPRTFFNNSKTSEFCASLTVSPSIRMTLVPNILEPQVSNKQDLRYMATILRNKIPRTRSTDMLTLYRFSTGCKEREDHYLKWVKIA